MDRRTFVSGISALSVALATRDARANATPVRVLVLVELKGGNDGLNTVVPYADPRYRQLRPVIGVARERVVQLDEHVGLHEKLVPLMDSWKSRDLAVVQGVGYPYPNRSHFRSIEIWDTASASSQTLSEGWISQAFEGVARPQGAGVDAIVVDTNSLPAIGPALRTIVMQDAENFLRQAKTMGDAGEGAESGNPALRHILGTRHEINAAAVGLSKRLREVPPPVYPYAEDGLWGRQLDLATRLIRAQVPVVAIKVALGGFDTHANQPPVQERLLGLLADGLSTLRKNLVAAGRWNDVVVMTYSEFGRRAKQNASNGTDHGTSAPHLVMGGKVKGGLHGIYPPLGDLEDGDLKHTVDFRSVFSTVASACWDVQQNFGQRRRVELDLI